MKEILLTGLPDKNPKPLLAALVDQDLLIYEAFSYNDSSTEGHLNIRFKKVCFTVLQYVRQTNMGIWETIFPCRVSTRRRPFCFDLFQQPRNIFQNMFPRNVNIYLMDLYHVV